MAGERKTILIVDDEPDTLTYFATLLEDNGYATITAGNGDEALARVSENAPDLITLDITMPEKSGVKFYREMKESDELRGIPIIIVTGISSDFENFISTRRNVPPPEGYFQKPIDPDKFLATVRELLS